MIDPRDHDDLVPSVRKRMAGKAQGVRPHTRLDKKSRGGVMNAATRNGLADSQFAGPDRSFPVNDANHARNALARVSQFGSPEVKARVRATVHRKFPGIGAR